MTPPRWMKGDHQFQVTLPADITKSGVEEVASIELRWEVSATRKMTAYDKTQWEMDTARSYLERADAPLSQGGHLSSVEVDRLNSAIIHAVTAWVRIHARFDGCSNGDVFKEFHNIAPQSLRSLVLDAMGVLRRSEGQMTSCADAYAVAHSATMAVLDAAAQIPREHWRTTSATPVSRRLERPNVSQGSWIDTGRYRPAQVLKIKSEPPHIMTLCYGDEIDNDFRPHISEWRSLQRPCRLPSLKDVFSPGDWFRHARSGYGRVLVVRNTTMDVDYNGRTATLAPDAKLSKIEKINEPEPKNLAPSKENFPPGTWIRQDHFGDGFVINVDGDILTVLFDRGVVCISAQGDGPVVWKLDKPPLDISLPVRQRRIWWWRHDAARRGYRPCPCCGYPNLGDRDEYEPEQCLICGWVDLGDSEDEVCVTSTIPGAVDPDDQEWPNSGYSLTEARENFEARGLVFRADDPRSAPFTRVAALRKLLVQWLDKLGKDTPAWYDADWKVALRLRREIIDRMYAPVAQNISVFFFNCDSGWINFIITSQDQSIEVQASSEYDPFPGMMEWLEQVVDGVANTRFVINEEIGYVLFDILKEEGATILRISETDCPDFDRDDHKKICIDAEIDEIDFAIIFYTSFQSFVKNGYDASQWSSVTVAEQIAYTNPNFKPDTVWRMDRSALKSFARRRFPVGWLDRMDLDAGELQDVRRWVRESLDDSLYGQSGSELRRLHSEKIETLMK